MLLIDADSFVDCSVFAKSRKNFSAQVVQGDRCMMLPQSTQSGDRSIVVAPDVTDKISKSSTSCAQIRGQVGFV